MGIKKKTSKIEQNNLKQIMKMLRLTQEAKFIQNSKNKTEGLKCTELKQIYKLISYK